jgi:hypothetical protein
MKHLILILFFAVAGLWVYGQEIPQKTEVIQTKELTQSEDKSEVKEVPKVSGNQKRIQKTQQQLKQVKKAQLQRQKTVKLNQQKKAIKRRNNHK